MRLSVEEGAFVKTVSIISFYYLHDSNPVNRGKPQCNSEMVQLQRHLNCVFYFRKLCLHSIVYPSQYVLTKQINTKWFSKDKKVFTTQNHYKECTLYL